MNEQEFAELSAAAALHALSPDDERRFRTAMTVHPEWRRIARADEEAAAALAASVAPVAPPAGIRASLLAVIAETTPAEGGPVEAPRTPATDSEAHARQTGDDDARGGSHVAGSGAPAVADDGAEAPVQKGGRGLRLLFALAACIVLIVGIGIGTAALNGSLNPPASVVALEQIENAPDAQQASVELPDGGSATAHWSGSLGTAVLVTDGIAAPADGETYELWFVRGETPVSAGTFQVDGGDATALLQGDMEAGDVIAVTVEQVGGSPTGKPTTDPVIVIPTA
ncbi:anti-sigma factor [Streptomyces sp. AC495_CC817]|uniref:anti-sigma factor n=1 Tax=Streptomyces sp. AC495_CC817 TaxID=2823900 RepID=UPI001C2514FC|nr:anti-sigma factor [Streptomyces sp. AC495_CC817]